MTNHSLRLHSSELLSSKILLGIPTFVRPGKPRGAKAAGLRYERLVKESLGRYPHFVAGPWFEYRTRSLPSRINYVQPDGLFIDVARGLVIVVEVKFNHVADAYFQLLNRYVPIIEKFFDASDLWRIACVEVVRWHDPHVAFPCKVTLIKDILDANPSQFSVHVLRP